MDRNIGGDQKLESALIMRVFKSNLFLGLSRKFFASGDDLD